MRLVNHRGVIARNDIWVDSSCSPLIPAQGRVIRGCGKLLTGLEERDLTRVAMQYVVLGRSKIGLAKSINGSACEASISKGIKPALLACSSTSASSSCFGRRARASRGSSERPK